MRIISQTTGRITLELRGIATGRDLAVILTGGDAHIGAAAFADSTGQASFVQAPSHREGELARNLALLLAARLHCNVAAVCGIHYDRITSEEIGTIEQMAIDMAEKMAEMHNAEPE